jgi:ABC-type methionine transport system permease subunit
LDPDILVGRRTVQQIKMTPDNAKALLTAATPTIAMLSLSQINEVAALIGSVLGIAFLLWRWRKQWKAGQVKNSEE